MNNLELALKDCEEVFRKSRDTVLLESLSDKLNKNLRFYYETLSENVDLFFRSITDNNFVSRINSMNRAIKKDTGSKYKFFGR